MIYGKPQWGGECPAHEENTDLEDAIDAACFEADELKRLLQEAGTRSAMREVDEQQKKLGRAIEEVWFYIYPRT